MPMLSKTYIGKYYEGGQELSVCTRSILRQDNDSYVILGESGYGKSVAAQSIVLQKRLVRRILSVSSTSTTHLTLNTFFLSCKKVFRPVIYIN